MAAAGLEVNMLPERAMRWLAFPLDLPLPARYLLAAVVVLGAYASRGVLQIPVTTLGFLTFYPAVVLVTLALGAGPGMFTLSCCVVLAARYTCPLLAHGALDAAHLIALIAFGASCIVLCVCVEHQHRARARLVETEGRLCGLLASSHVGVVLTDEHGAVVEYNEAYRNLLGYSASELRGLDTGRVTLAAAAQAAVAPAAPGSRNQVTETQYVRADGTRVPVRLSTTRYATRRGRLMQWTMVEDLSCEHDALRESARHLRELKVVAGNRLVGILLVKQRRVAWANEAFATMFGYRPEEIIGQTTRILHADQADADAFRETMRPVMEAGGVFRSLVRQVRKDGSVGWYVMSCAATSVDGDEQIGTFVDVTERKRLEAAVRDAAARERRKLGMDLHDGLGQELTGISMLVGALRSTHEPAARERLLGRIETIARRSVATCRQVARGLSPVAEGDGALAAALGDMIEQRALGTGVDVRLEVMGTATIPCPPDVVDQLFRIAQESVTNAVKHAAAQSVTVRLTEDDGFVHLEVADDGAANGHVEFGTQGMGLKIMRDRASRIGAQLSIGAPATGRGTVVTCHYERDPVCAPVLAARDAVRTGLRPLGGVRI